MLGGAVGGGRCAEDPADPATATTTHNNSLQARVFVPGWQESPKMQDPPPPAVTPSPVAGCLSLRSATHQTPREVKVR